jgi:indolepyruvate ferredoxin oxidoreductase alpha subunit
VEVDDIKLPARKSGKFQRNTEKFCSLPPFAIDNHVRLYERIKQLEKVIPDLKLNKIIPGDATTGIITSGIPFGYTMEALHQLDLDDIPVLKLGMTYPLNEGEIIEFIGGLEKVIIVEELEPFLEVKIGQIAHEHGLPAKIIGKEAFPKHDEYNTGLVASCLSNIFTEIKPNPWIKRAKTIFSGIKSKIPSRFPTFCPGCPERAMLMEIKKATNNLNDPETIIAGDIGCYVMGIMPPLKISDFIICMSGGLSAAIGLSKKTDEKIIALIGDSTLMHTGLPVLADAVANNADVLLVVFDNRWVAMTGHQPPSGKGKLSIEHLCKAFGVSWVKIVDPFAVDSTVSAIRYGLNKPGLKVIICQRECALVANRYLLEEKRVAKSENVQFGRKSYQVYNCVMCEKCVELLSCPAMRRTMDEFGNEVMKIDEDRCTSCGVCAQICPHGRIKTTVIHPHLETQLELRRLEGKNE